MSSFARLHPHLQHGIVHDLGWRDLRPVQNLTIDAVLDGDNAVVLAPTAGGKTEASIFPALSRILSEGLEPVSTLYLCPIRALLNNQEERLRSYARMVGLDVFKWHGDVSDSRKQTFRNRPEQILMTTPESLEVMLISARTDARALFSGLSMVIIDEVHAFAGDDRGAHLAALLERLVAINGRDIQRIGLSATVGNPHQIGAWLQGSSQRRFRLVDPPKPKADRELHVRFCDGLGEVARAAGAISRGRKSLVFVESRAKAERVAQSLHGSGVEVFIHHSSVSRADRALAEAQFASGSNTAIVCTSTMELGIDVGDLDQVLQVDAPGSVASFLQRLGRTGRRTGTRANCTFFCTSPESLLQSVALLRLAERGWVEDVRPPTQAMHVLAHQVLALTLQEGGISRHDVRAWVDAAYPFSKVPEARLQGLVDTMVARDILYEADARLSLGARGERLYGRKNFFELYAVFTAPPVMRVVRGKEEVGYVQAMFVSMHDPKDGPLCFRLSGRAWEVVKTEWTRGVLHVRPATHGRVPTWLGMPGVLSAELCAAMMDVLTSEGGEAAWLDVGAQTELRLLREGYEGLLEPGAATLEVLGEGVQLHTFAGGAVNRVLAAGLSSITDKRWQAGNLSVRAREVGATEGRAALASLGGLDWEAIAADAAKDMARGTISKFQPCLPEEAEAALLADHLLDVPATLRYIASTRVQVYAGEGAAPVRLHEEVTSGPIGLDLDVPAAPDALTPKNPVTWVDTPAALSAAVSELSSSPTLGLDVETTLDFGTLCLVQLATPTRTYLIDALRLDISPLAGLLSAPEPTKLIHNAKFERRVLAEVGIPLDGVVDTLEVSRRVRGIDALGGHSLAAVCERELGALLDKREQTSNWTRRPLGPGQLRYAALDAEVLLALWRKLSG